MSAARLVAATPSPPPTLHMPPTPRLGFGDNWEPYSPRKSARLASKPSSTPSSSSSAVMARTPSPAAAATRRAALRSPRQQANNSNNINSSIHRNNNSYKLQPTAAMSSLSPAATPRKKRTTAYADGTDGASHSHPFLSPEDAVRARKKAAAAAAAAALPTPAKTPSRKKHAASQNASNIAAIARNLFHTDGPAHSTSEQEDPDDMPTVDDVMASPSRRRTKAPRQPKTHTALTLEGFAAVEAVVEEPIAIFTDSQDRVPEVDISNENPFYGSGADATTAAAAISSTTTALPATPERAGPARRRRSKRNNNVVSIPGEGPQAVADAARREDGLVYVFRGKKIFRKFDDSTLAQEEDILDGVTPGRRITRSAIKPRLLFPQEALRGSSSGEGLSTTDDEEALTDIEDQNLHSDEEEIDDEEETAEMVDTAAQVSAAVVADTVGTPAAVAAIHHTSATPPNAPRLAPSSPPGTAARATRSTADAAAAGDGGGRAKRRSPFDGWRQTKRGAGTTATPVAAGGGGHKRPVEEATATSAKRSRI